ncbi:MAG: hypothetical protein J5917_06650 [Bacteroidales bacterium]|nr:hypothetical protein [Bacteroidales bacterium]
MKIPFLMIYKDTFFPGSMLVRAVSIPESAALFSDNGRIFLAFPEMRARFSADGSRRPAYHDTFVKK